MLREQSVLETSSLYSTTAGSSTLKPKGGRIKKVLVASVMLTSLVDAFSILVIYLLMNFSTSEDIIFLNQRTELPEAAQILELEQNTVIRIEESKFFVKDAELDESGLIAHLIEVRKAWAESPEADIEGMEPGVIIQADRLVAYDLLNKVVLASNHAGFSDIHFAVLRK